MATTYEFVLKVLIEKKGLDQRLFGWWDLVGPKVVVEDRGTDVQTIRTMFCTDPIAVTVLKAMVRKNPAPSGVFVYQKGIGKKDEAKRKEAQDMLTSEKEAELVVASGSRFLAVLLKGSNGSLVLNVWDLMK